MDAIIDNNEQLSADVSETPTAQTPPAAEPVAPTEEPSVVGAPDGAGMREEVRGKREDASSSPIPHPSYPADEQPVMVVSSDGVVRPNPHAEAPLAGRSAERNALRRENKAAVVDAANADAQRLGGWGNNGQAASPLPNVNRRQRNEWIGKVIRQWSKQKKAALLEGTAKLVANGGYRFLQELWERGVPMTNEDAIDALEVCLQAKQG